MKITDLVCPVCGDFAIEECVGTEGGILCTNGHDWRRDMSANVKRFPDGNWEIDKLFHLVKKTTETGTFKIGSIKDMFAVEFPIDCIEPIQNDYWKERCLLAEKLIEGSAFDFDISKEGVDTYNKWQEMINE